MITAPYEVSNEYNITELLSHLDSNYIFDIINDKLENSDWANVLPEPNVVVSFEENFKLMTENFPGDAQNIRDIRTQVYSDIILILCDKFNLQFNEADENINLYTAAFYLYDFLICNRNNIMITFFTSFIAYNKDSLSRFLNLDDYRKGKDSASAYGKRIYSDQKYGIISANMNKVLNHIATLDISLLNILQSVYTSPEVIAFFDNAIADKGNFFKDFYCSALEQPEALPIIITNIRLSLQKIVGDISPSNIQEIMSYGGEFPNE